MLTSLLLVASSYVLGATAAAGNVKRAERPECVSKCWDYTQYVSPSCLGDTQCLCNDSEYQNAVYQCLYSQCMTAQFANALHHTLGICHTAPVEADDSEEQSSHPTPPSLLKQDTQNGRKRKRQMPYQSVSNSAGAASVTRSAGPSVTRSAGSSATQSVARGQMSVSASAYMGYGSARAAATPSATLSVAMPGYRRVR